MLMLALTLGGAWRLGPRVWQQVEPAHGQLLLPPWPWQQPLISPAASDGFISELGPGWRATNLGNPAASHYRTCWQSLPRTPWDLALSDGTLFVGLGNASNRGPSANAGPVPLLAYSLNDQRWQQHATLPEEEVHRFVKQGADLWLPGADARGSWRWGNLYRRHNVNDSWWQERRLPQFIHVHDLVWHRNQLVVAGNVPDAVSSGPPQERHGSALASSSDEGNTWSVHRLKGWRATALLPVDDQLYAVQALPGPALRRWLTQSGRFKGFTAVQQWQGDGDWLPRPDLTASALLPDVAGAGERSAWIEGASPNGHAVAWIASLGPWGPERPRRAAFLARSLRPGAVVVQPVALRAGEEAMDWQIDGDGGWHLLSSEKLGSARWRNRISQVHVSPDTSLHPHTLVSFEAPLSAWSLEGDHQRWFVGLGHPPFEPEPAPGHCPAGADHSGTVLQLLRQ